MSHTATCARDDHRHTDFAGEPGRAAVPSQPGPAVDDRAAKTNRARWYLAVPQVRWSALSLLLFTLGLWCWDATAHPLAWGCFIGCYICGGWEPGLAGLKALRARTLDVDLLMVVAAVVAAGIGQVVDGALLVVIFATSGALEALATRRTRDSVRALLDLAPQQACRLGPDGSEALVGTADLAAGDVIVVRPGERIGGDGTVVDGASEVDQASITGEPLPVAKGPGDEVLAGTVNGTGVLRVQVERAAAGTVMAQIVALVEQASATKATTQLFVEKIQQRYSVSMVAATIALVLVPLAAGSAFQPTLLRAMTFMIVASPCGVVLATMPPLLSGIANAGRHGVLVKSAVVMEELGRTDLVAFDKTGTLTEGEPHLTDALVVPGAELEADAILSLAACAETGSEHPLGRAVVAAARQQGLAVTKASEFASIPGRGVGAVVNGRLVEVSNPGAAGDPSHLERPEAALVARLHSQGRTAVVVTVDGEPVGVLGLTDRVRPAAAGAVAALRDLTGRPPILLTGDSQAAADRVAAEVGIVDARAQMLPHDKVAVVHQLQADGTCVTMVGDGVNDAPGLAAAHLGLAMGRSGADLTLETADAVIVSDELTAIAAVIDLSRTARRVVVQNLWVAVAVICALVAIDLAGRLPLPLGVAGHEGSTVVIGLNGLRLLAPRAWRPRTTRAITQGRESLQVVSPPM